MKKFLILLLLALTAICTGCGESPKINKVLIIGLDDEYAPMSFRDPKGNIVGFDIDLAKEAAKRLGVKFEFKPINWNNKREEITSGNIDIIWNGCDITDERKEYMIFSKPYMDNRQILLVKKGNDQNIRSVHDLEGKIVGTQTGSSSETYINETTELKNSFKEFKVYRNYKDALNDLYEGKVDVLVIDEIVGRYGLTRNPNKFAVLEVTVGSPCEVAIAFRKNDVELRDKVQKVFDDMVKDGTAKRISEHWFSADIVKIIR